MDGEADVLMLLLGPLLLLRLLWEPFVMHLETNVYQQTDEVMLAIWQ